VEIQASVTDGLRRQEGLERHLCGEDQRAVRQHEDKARLLHAGERDGAERRRLGQVLHNTDGGQGNVVLD
ncbi:hypothetical protein diail_8227, partial [Diaporthe ilicicola]